MCIYIYIIYINKLSYIYILICVCACVCVSMYTMYMSIYTHTFSCVVQHAIRRKHVQKRVVAPWDSPSHRRSSDQVLLSCHSWTSCLCTSPAKLHAARCRHRGRRCRVVDSTAFRGAVPKTHRSDSHRQIVVPKVMKNEDW